jgi:ketosteroid isomerase-like protein
MAATEDFQQFVEHVQAAMRQFVTGNPVPLQGLWSHADDVTVFGGFGAYEQGWEQVGSNVAWASARFRGGSLTFETLAMGINGDLAYTCWLEKGEVRVAGREEPGPLAVRVTHIYRREEGSWKLIHRHGDAILEKIEAAAVLPP